jgi:hypothetical protein
MDAHLTVGLSTGMARHNLAGQAPLVTEIEQRRVAVHATLVHHSWRAGLTRTGMPPRDVALVEPISTGSTQSTSHHLLLLDGCVVAGDVEAPGPLSISPGGPCRGARLSLSDFRPLPAHGTSRQRRQLQSVGGNGSKGQGWQRHLPAELRRPGQLRPWFSLRGFPQRSVSITTHLFFRHACRQIGDSRTTTLTYSYKPGLRVTGDHFSD